MSKNENQFSRRKALRLMGAAGATAFVAGGSKTTLWPMIWPTTDALVTAESVDNSFIASRVVNSALFAPAPRVSFDVSQLSCVTKPALTEGPFFVDERLNRSDIRPDPSNNTVKQGAQLKLKFFVSRVTGTNTCTPLVGAWFDIWHTDALGAYSDVNGQGNPNNLGQKFLRGYQVTDANGSVEFTTIYPGWYQGRTVHIHYKVRLFDGATRTYDFTSQLTFDDTLTDQVFTQAPYNTKGARNTRNNNDGIAQQGGAAILLNVTSDSAGGYTATHGLGLTGLPATVAAVSTVSAATFASGALAGDSIAALFGTDLATSTAAASTTPLPTTLGGIQVTVRDANGTTRNAPLFFVSPTQINYQIPAGTSAGTATISVLRSGSTVGQGTLAIESVSPGLFTANSTGQGVPAAVALRIKANGEQTYEPVVQFDQAQAKFVAVPLDLGAATDQLYLIPFGTGFRNRSALSAVSCTIGSANAEVIYAGAQGQLVGVDQANILIPRSVAGRGNVDLVFRVDGKTANTVSINIK
ncbi:MAG: hypothetical protein ACKVZH_22730 [Blastocatellia bacterium]